MKNKIFIVPQNDLESVEIVKILKEGGWKENEDLFITNQTWGASWEGLEPEILGAIRYNAERIKTDVDYVYGGGDIVTEIMSRAEYEQLPHESSLATRYTTGEPIMMQPDFSKIYGVELKGYSFGNNIDHHYYCDKNWDTGEIIYKEDRTKDENGKPKKSSIEQIAEIIGIELTLDQMFISANDRGFVEEMQRYGKSILMSSEEISAKIKDIRMREHEILAQVQGITPEMEQQAVEAINNAIFAEDGCMIVHMPHSKCATITDRIPEQEYNGGLLIISDDGEINYYGSVEKVGILTTVFGGWHGDISSGFTYWGCKGVDPEEVITRVTGEELECTFTHGGDKR